jgi:hypothetical protein
MRGGILRGHARCLGPERGPLAVLPVKCKSYRKVNQKFVRAAIVGLAAALVMSPVASIAASEFEGVWNVKDTAGTRFEITLAENGAAKANRGEAMSGTWKEEGKTAVIMWSTGWVTKIAKDGDHYRKTAYRKGQPLDSAPANSSDAVKIK